MASPQQIARLLQTAVDLFKTAQHGRAEALLLEATGKDPKQHGAWYLLGVLALKDGRNELAVSRCQRALALAPTVAPYLSNLGEAQRRTGNHAEALEIFQRALAISPDFAEAHHNLGLTYEALGQWPLAVEAFETAIALKPEQLESQRRLGGALRRLKRFDEALECLRAAATRAPGHAATHAELALVWKDTGCVEAAVDSLRRAVELDPTARETHGNLIYTLAFDPGATPQDILAEARRFAEQHARASTERPEAREPRGERKLRVGFVSPDFCDHVLAHFYLPLFRHLDRDAFAVYCYSNVRTPDSITERVREAADTFRDISGSDDEQALRLIRADGIDILVDLAMHMMENRLPLFARRPAPVQATWLAYPGTTGLEAIDYRLTDPHLDPPDYDVTVYAEKTLRLADTFWCYAPLEADVPVRELPALSNGHITFGCLNNICKLNDGVLELWARALNAVPGSRLLLLAPPGATQRRIQKQLAKLGVDPARVRFADFGPRRAYLENYWQIDIALDTLPYNGHTTSIDALWMGVPVVTLVGSTLVGRAGLSQMTNLQLTELVADTPEAFVSIARSLAEDLPKLSQLRASLRKRLEASPLMDQPRFARAFEACLREMWQQTVQDSVPS